jgi:hypothetical protein
MAKIRIAQNPSFKATVLIPIVGSEPEKIEFTFKYRDRLELAALFDEWNRNRKDALAALGDQPSLQRFKSSWFTGRFDQFQQRQEQPRSHQRRV